LQIRPGKVRPSLGLIALLALLAAGASTPMAAQVVSGKLLEQGTNKPIHLASVTLLTDQNAPAGPVAKSGNDGRWSLTAPRPGVYRLLAEHPGYHSVISPAIELSQDDHIELTWHLAPDSAFMRAITVTSTGRRNASPRLAGFQERLQRHHFGTFIARDQIEKAHPVSVVDLLRTVPGLVVDPSPRGIGWIVRTTEGCTPAVYLDGVRYPLTGETIDEIVDPMSLEGIEVYAHASEVPVEFQTPGATCGAILLWTRDR
jgi:hypothetical protein